MKQIVEKIVEKYDGLIRELEAAEDAHNEYLKKATQSGSVPLEEVNKRMSLARDNHRRLQTAKAEREHLIENHLRG